MDKQPIHKTSLWERFINGRGFYIALVVCLLAIGGVAIATFGGTMFSNPSANESQPDAHAAEHPVTDQPDERPTTVSTTTTTSATTLKTTAATKAADLFVLPMGNLVQKEYSDGRLAYSVTMRDWRVHDGTDFAGALGQEVKALADGKVSEIREDPLWGSMITVDHGMEVCSVYCGVTASVKSGDTVKVGQTIGKLTTIPCESKQEPHLHLEMIIKGIPADPVEALGRDVRYENDEPEESALAEE